MAEITRYAVSQAWSDYDLRLDDDSPSVDRYEFNEAAHPRFAAGSPNSVGGEFRPTGMSGGGGSGGGGAVSSSRFNAGLQPQVSQPQASRSQQPQQPQQQPQQPQQPRTSKKRELADRPDIQKGHKLHLSQLPDELRAKVYDWDYRMGQLLAPMYYAQSQVSPDKQDEALEQSWSRVDKNQVRSMLAEMNKMDFDARSQGIQLSDFVNANGVIPKMLGERLDGGARFFDPEKLRGKLGGGPQSNEPSPSTQKWLDSQSKPAVQASSPEAAAITKKFSEASRTARSKMLANPSMREAIETAMGIKNPGGVVDPNLARPLQAEPKTGKPAKENQPEESKPTRSLKHLPEANRALRALGYKSSDAGALLRKVLAAGTPFSNADELVTAAMSSSAGSQSARARDDGLTSTGTNKLESAIANAVGGDDLDKKNYFKQVALDAWKQMKSDADDHNDALRQIAGHFGKSLGTLASNLTQGVDTAKIKGFDQLIDHAVREYPQIVSRLMGESSSGSPEDALAAAISEGIRPVPQPWDDEVIDRAAGLVGPGFFEDSADSADQQTAASDEPWDGVPFSVRSDIVHWVQRYWYLEDIERYCQVEASIERYAQTEELTEKTVVRAKKTRKKRSHPMHAAKPTEAQKEAGNYRMAHINVHGLDISIETPKGRARREGWPKMKAHYGYIRGTQGRDGDHVDVFVGPDRSSEMVYVIDQSSLGGKFDEHKCLIGFTSMEAAIAAYRDSYKIGWIVGKVTPMTIDQFKAWLKGGNQNKPIAGQVSRYSFEPTLIDRYTWNEADHPRGQPENKGEFVKVGESKVSSVSIAADKKTEAFTKLMESKTPSDKEAFQKAKLDGIAIPPAWTEVKYYGKDADIIAEGRDAKGRKQRAENSAYRQRISDENNARIASTLTPRINAIRDHLRVAAAIGNEESKVLYLIAMTGFRIGGKGDGKADTQAFGASTLTGDHVAVDGDTVTFDFSGKKGVRQLHSISDPVIANMVRNAEPGKPIFNTRDTKIRDAWKKLGGVKVHDIRHVVASELAETELKKRVPPKPDSKKKLASLIKEVGTIVGAKLGNNPSQAIGTYIDPGVWEVAKA